MAKPAAKKDRGDPHKRIDAIVAVLAANGISLPRGLAVEEAPDTEGAEDE